MLQTSTGSKKYRSRFLSICLSYETSGTRRVLWPKGAVQRRFPYEGRGCEPTKQV